MVGTQADAGMTERKAFLYQPAGRANETHAFIAGRQDGLYAVNHARGCAHGCRYPCYARLILKSDYEAWIHPTVFEDAPRIVENELKRHYDVEDVELCFTTDPYMHGVSMMHRVSNLLIDVITKYGAGVTVLTKGDIDGAVVNPKVKYGISLISLSEPFRHTFEPNTTPYKERIGGLRLMHDIGMPTWVSIEPFPAAEQARSSVLELIENVGWVDKAVLGRWNYAGVKDVAYYNQVAEDFAWVCQQHGIQYLVKSDITKGVSPDMGVIK